MVTKSNRAMTKKYVFHAGHKSRGHDLTHVCDQTCSNWMTSTTCAFSKFRFPYDECNRYFRSQSCFATAKRKSTCEHKRCCAMSGLLVTDDRHECNKLFCANCKQIRDVGHLCFIRPLKDCCPAPVIRYYI